MSDTSPRLKMTLPVEEELADVDILNSNFLLLEGAVGAAEATSAARPAAWERRIIRETDTGRAMWFDPASDAWLKLSADVDLCTSATRPTGAARRSDRMLFETDTNRMIHWDGTRWRYEGDYVILASAAEQSTVTAYVGLRAYRSDIKVTLIVESMTTDATPAPVWVEQTLANTAPAQVAYGTDFSAYVDAGTPWNGVQFWRRNGTVTVAGAISINGTKGSGATAFTMPVGFRPPATVQATMDGTSPFDLLIRADGIGRTAGTASGIHSFTVTYAVA